MSWWRPRPRPDVGLLLPSVGVPAWRQVIDKAREWPPGVELPDIPATHWTPFGWRSRYGSVSARCATKLEAAEFA
jgi:hypothetical protein